MENIRAIRNLYYVLLYYTPISAKNLFPRKRNEETMPSVSVMDDAIQTTTLDRNLIPLTSGRDKAPGNISSRFVKALL